jgi:hypothetical protein
MSILLYIEQHCLWCILLKNLVKALIFCWGRRGRDRRVVGFTTTYAISVYHY